MIKRLVTRPNLTVAAALIAVLFVALPANASSQITNGQGSDGQGSDGQRLALSQSSHLNDAGQTITVTGSGFNTAKGIYLAFCVKPKPGAVPTPCGGGADTSGKTGSSVWISSNPPSYGKGLAVSYGAGGTFTVQLHIAATLNETTDCRKVRCAVVTRADHTRTEDRSQDVIVAVSFDGKATSTSKQILRFLVPLGLFGVLAAIGTRWWIRRRVGQSIDA
ncbi:hypothetical protein ACSMXN_02965 [Jatrophihabitans sp. DSM 45814]